MPSAPVVVVTREHEDNLPLIRRLGEMGVETLEYPCIATRIIPYTGEPLCSGKKLDDFRAVAFASKRGVEGMRQAAASLKNSKALLAAVGEGTALAIQNIIGRKADLIAEPQTGEGLAKAIIARLEKPAPVLYVQGNKTTGELRSILTKKGFEVCDLVVYENYAPRVERLELKGPAIAVFASPSAGETFFAANSHLKDTAFCVAIGPTTEKFLKTLGIKKIAAASKPGLEELVSAISGLVNRGGEF